MKPGGSRWRRIAPYEGDSGFSGFIPGVGQFPHARPAMPSMVIRRDGVGPAKGARTDLPKK
jgi:hypothetical protein